MQVARRLARAEAPRDDAAQDAGAVAETVEATLAVLARGAAHRHLDDAAAGAQHAEQQVDLDVEAVARAGSPAAASRRGTP